MALSQETERRVRARNRGFVGLTRAIAATDTLVVVLAVVFAQVARFGDFNLGAVGASRVNYTAVSAGLVLGWVGMLVLHSAYDARFTGHGVEEYKRVLVATFRFFALVAIVAYVVRVDLARGYVALAFPAGACALLVNRWLWRRWLVKQRLAGRLSASVLAVGDRKHLTALVSALESVPGAGYRVVAACCGDGSGDDLRGVPVVGTEGEAAEVAGRLGVDTVACTSSWALGSRGLRELGWALEGSGIDLVVSPGLTEIAGPRIATRPVAGLPLLHIEAPTFGGPRLVLKTVLDRAVSALALVLLSPVLLVIAVVVRRESAGGAIYRQERIGREGQPFTMFKFRTMVTGAEALLPGLVERSEGAGPLFKIRDDPRVTKVGLWLRRYSLDELPQLINVLRGEMSLVGPRPPLATEVSTYADDVRRRLLVKPGMTGLWQVNGRSDLSWEDAVRLDLYYVENWSVVLDLMILLRTFRAVRRAAGAY